MIPQDKDIKKNQVICGDALTELYNFPSNSIDCIVTDPPYGYSFMNKDWDKAVIPVRTWRECKRVLKPGSFAAIMSSPRQDVLSRMIVNLQDAGFKTDYTSIYWTYASGFPKAGNVSKIVDKKLGLEREIIGKSNNGVGKISGSGIYELNNPDSKMSKDYNLTSSVSKEAQTLDGSYLGFQPKPAIEVVLMVMKPLSRNNSYVDQALSNGKGVSWLDDCRIPFTDEQDQPESRATYTENSFPHIKKDGGRPWVTKRLEQGLPVTDYKSNSQGRFPANLLVSDNVLNESYSHFFDLDKWFDTTFPFLEVPKATDSERSKGLDRWLIKKDIGHNRFDKCSKCGGYILQNETRPSKCKCEEPQRQNNIKTGNFHPTVKPLKLMSWLVTLISRPKDTVLDPFCGSGTTCLASRMLNRDYLGIELNPEYVEIAQARLKREYIQLPLSLISNQG